MTIRDLFVPFEDELQLLPSKRVPNAPLIEWKSAFGDLFFRLKGAEPSVLWCVLGRSAPPKRPLSSARLATLGKHISSDFASCTFFRVVPFPDDDGWLLVRPKRALVKSPSQKTGAIWQWKADFGKAEKQIVWLSRPLDWFENWLQQQPPHELEPARAFLRLSDKERSWTPIVGEAGACHAWKTLVPALQKLTCDSPQASTWRLSRMWQSVVVQQDWTPARPELPLATQNLLSYLQRRFPLQFVESNWRAIGVRGKKEETPTLPMFILQSPSQHERLEATLLWRDFAREIGKEAEIGLNRNRVEPKSG